MPYQWYPGHMNKAKKQMQEDLKLIDVIIELLDARIPYSSKNPDIDKLAKNKSRVLLLNKSDMADKAKTEVWKKYYEKKGYYVALINSRNGNGIKTVNQLILEACQEKLARNVKKGILNRPVRAMIVGIPNVGKSTFINSFAGKACAKTGNKPGITKGKQWIKLNKQVELLDTPGILWPKFDDQKSGMRVAFIGSINENILNQTELAYELCRFLYKNYKGILTEKYGIEEEDDGLILIQRIAEKRGCIMKGGQLDVDKASIFIMDDFRNARIGNITLELPSDILR